MLSMGNAAHMRQEAMMTITTEQIRGLRNGAGEAGDLEQVAICDRALAGDTEAITICAEVIADALAQG